MNTILHLTACDNCGEPIDDNGQMLCPTCKPQPRTVYQRNGYADRAEYLASLAEEYGADIVNAAAELLGESEDFDGLVSTLEDYSGDSTYYQDFDEFSDADPGL